MLFSITCFKYLRTPMEISPLRAFFGAILGIYVFLLFVYCVISCNFNMYDVWNDVLYLFFMPNKLNEWINYICYYSLHFMYCTVFILLLLLFFFSLRKSSLSSTWNLGHLVLFLFSVCPRCTVIYITCCTALVGHLVLFLLFLLVLSPWYNNFYHSLFVFNSLQYSVFFFFFFFFGIVAF